MVLKYIESKGGGRGWRDNIFQEITVQHSYALNQWFKIFEISSVAIWTQKPGCDVIQFQNESQLNLKCRSRGGGADYLLKNKSGLASYKSNKVERGGHVNYKLNEGNQFIAYMSLNSC